MGADVEFGEERSQGASGMVTGAGGRGAYTSPRRGWVSVRCGARQTTLGALGRPLELMWGSLEETRCLKP